MSTTNGAALLGVSFTMISMATLTTGLRLYSRRAQNARFGPDDWVIIPAWVFFVAIAVIAIYLVQNHMVGISAEAMATAHVSQMLRYKIILASDVAGCVSEGLTRISGLLFIRRIFCVADRGRWLAITIWAGIALLMLWMITFITLPLLQCGPSLAEAFSSSPEVMIKECNRGLGPPVAMSYTLSNVIMEALIIALPIPLVWRLHASVKRRLSILFVFATAFLSLGSSIARTNAALNENYIASDEEADEMENRFFFILGAGAALIAVNLPSIYWIAHKIRPEQFLFSLRSLFRSDSWLRETSNNKSNLQGRIPSNQDFGLHQVSTASSTEKEGGIYKSYTIDMVRYSDSKACPVHDV